MDRTERSLRPDHICLDIAAPDGPEGRACRTAYFQELARRFEGGFDAERGKTANDEDMTAPHGAFVVARHDGKAVGCGGFCRFDPETAEVKRMWVAAEARGLGIARRLLHELERRAATAGYRVVRLDTNRALGEAQAFYRKEGYREIARYNANPYADFWFEKQLS